MEYILVGMMSSVVYLKVVSWCPFCSSYTEYCSDLYTKLYIYVDDTKLFRYISNSVDQHRLQSGINKVGVWAKEWLLKLNVEKCCGMSFAANINIVRTRKYYIEESKILHP